jgi:hypothetical protein
VYSERSNRKHLEAYDCGKVMSVSLSGIWSVASETYMFMVALRRDLYRYFAVCYLLNHVGYASLSHESINIITVTWNPFMIFPIVDTTFFPLTLLIKDAMFISCRGRGKSGRKSGQLFIFCLPHSLWFQEICVIY